jgi:hypothetical protein
MKDTGEKAQFSTEFPLKFHNPNPLDCKEECEMQLVVIKADLHSN